MSKYTNEQIAAKEDLWNDYYNTSATSTFSDCTYGERLKMLNRDYPDEKSDEDRAAISAAARVLGKIKSPRKAETSRENGKPGGSPKKAITQQMVKAVKAHDKKAWHDEDWWDFEKLASTTCIQCAMATCGKGAGIKDIAAEAIKGIVSID